MAKLLVGVAGVCVPVPSPPPPQADNSANATNIIGKSSECTVVAPWKKFNCAGLLHILHETAAGRQAEGFIENLQSALTPFLRFYRQHPGIPIGPGASGKAQHAVMANINNTMTNNLMYFDMSW